MTGATIKLLGPFGAHERERLGDRSPQIATHWNFAADRATVIDSAVFGTAIAASARLATQTGMAPITSRASNDRNVGTEAPNGEHDAHGQATRVLHWRCATSRVCTTKWGMQAEKHGISGAFGLDIARA
jgi:hypothetical protein